MSWNRPLTYLECGCIYAVLPTEDLLIRNCAEHGHVPVNSIISDPIGDIERMSHSFWYPNRGDRITRSWIDEVQDRAPEGDWWTGL